MISCKLSTVLCIQFCTGWNEGLADGEIGEAETGSSGTTGLMPAGQATDREESKWKNEPSHTSAHVTRRGTVAPWRTWKNFARPVSAGRAQRTRHGALSRGHHSNSREIHPVWTSTVLEQFKRDVAFAFRTLLRAPAVCFRPFPIGTLKGVAPLIGARDQLSR